MNVTNQTTLALASLFVGVIAISTGSIFIRLSSVELSPSAIVFNRFWLASVTFGLWEGYKAIRQHKDKDDKPVEQQPYTLVDVWRLVSAGILFAATLVCIAWSLTQTSVAISSVLHNLAPIFTSIGAWLLFRQGMKPQFLIGMAIALGGALAIEIEDLQMDISKVSGGLAAILSAVLVGAYWLCVEKLRTKFTATTIQLWVCAIAALVIFPWLVFTQVKLFPMSVNGWILVISLALICQVLGQGLFTYSLAKFDSVVVSLVHLLEPVFSGIFALAIFGERLSFWNWVSFAVVLIGLYLAIESRSAVGSLRLEPVLTIVNTSIKSITTKLSLLQKQLSETPVPFGTISLFFALIPISLAPSLTKLSLQEIGANAVVFHRSWIATVVFGLFSGVDTWRRHSNGNQPVEYKPFTRWEVALLLFMGTASATYLLLWSWSLSQTNVADLTLLSNLNPLFIALAGYLLFGRRWERKFVIGLVIALVGAIAFELENVQFASDQILGDALALLTAIFIATYQLLVERLRARFNTTTIMLWRCGVTTLFLLPVLPLVEDRLFPYSWIGWFLIIFQALFCQVLGQGLLAYSLGKLSSGVVAVTLLAEPVLTSIFAVFILSEQVGLFDWVSFALVLVGIYLAQSSQSAVKVTNEGIQDV